MYNVIVLELPYLGCKKLDDYQMVEKRYRKFKWFAGIQQLSTILQIRCDMPTTVYPLSPVQIMCAKSLTLKKKNYIKTPIAEDHTGYFHVGMSAKLG